MNVWLEDFNKYLLIAGFSDVKIRDVNRFFQAVKDRAENACVQFFDALLIASWEHLYFAALNALNAFKGKVNISTSLGMETLLYASAQRQIKEAVRLMGIKLGTSRVAVLILAETSEQTSEILRIVSELLGGKRDDSVLDLTDDKMADLKRLFEISKVELEAKTEHKGTEKQALKNLVFEHMALLVTQR